MSTEVIYAIDDSKQHWFMLRKSIESLRRHNKNIPITVVHFTDKPATPDSPYFRTVRLAPPKCHPTQLKWRALLETSADTVLYLDADTYVHMDIDLLLRAHGEADFYAREEVGTERHGKHRMVSGTLLQHQLDRALFHRICQALGSANETVFNTGVMIFNHGSARKRIECSTLHGNLPSIPVSLDKRIDFYASKFRSGDYAYPSTNPHITEEIAAAIALGQLGRVHNLTLDPLQSNLAPFFIERSREAFTNAWAVVEHSWTPYYPYMLLREEGREVALTMPGIEKFDLG